MLLTFFCVFPCPLLLLSFLSFLLAAEAPAAEAGPPPVNVVPLETLRLQLRIGSAFRIFDHDGSNQIDARLVGCCCAYMLDCLIDPWYCTTCREVGTVIRALGCCPTEQDVNDIIMEVFCLFVCLLVCLLLLWCVCACVHAHKEFPASSSSSSSFSLFIFVFFTPFHSCQPTAATSLLSSFYCCHSARRMSRVGLSNTSASSLS